MYISLDTDQARVLREIVDHARTELLFEIARSDVREFREQLVEREHVVESLQAKLSDQAATLS
jgi:hypothetical protein